MVLKSGPEPYTLFNMCDFTQLVQDRVLLCLFIPQLFFLFSTGENGKRNRLKYVLCERESKRHYRLIFSKIVNNFCYKRIGSGISLSLLLLGNSLRLINSISKKQTVPPAPIGRSMK